MATSLWMLAWFLKVLDDSGIYVFFAPGDNSPTLSTAMTLLAIGSLIAGVHGLVRRVVNHVQHRGVLLLAKSFGAIIATCFTAVLLFSAAVTLLGAPIASYGLKSPNDDRSVLILNQSFLLLGSFNIYEPRTWPIYSKTVWIATDDGFDPFLKGQYKETWTDAGLDLDYVFDYMYPEGLTRESIQLSRQKTHLGANGYRGHRLQYAESSTIIPTRLGGGPPCPNSEPSAVKLFPHGECGPVITIDVFIPWYDRHYCAYGKT
ncbi:hypothetical protein [Arthrobacter glacialis]|uniref:hypothetical protein n=1 Tax=Arthrobacter glacialis TaxID=1664 RepID=UPI0010572E78|nr:hypothetical protein [Arthrobacter glacialis]